jgi:hypothetical protein
LPKPAPNVSPLHRHLPWVASIAALACMLIALNIYWNKSSPGQQAPSALPFDRQDSVAKPTESKGDLPPGVEDQNAKPWRKMTIQLRKMRQIHPAILCERLKTHPCATRPKKYGDFIRLQIRP